MRPLSPGLRQAEQALSDVAACSEVQANTARGPQRSNIMSLRTSTLLATTALACALSFAAAPPASAARHMHRAHADIDCKLHYDLTGWSLVYKHTTGAGVVKCNNGESMQVHVSAKAVGLTAGKWHIDHGVGRFSDVHDIHEVLGRYAQASANAGLAKSGEAQVLSKGPVQLALAGGGEGVNLGVDVGAFTISR
jgi:hypothetical protein